jgi:hypothetical protein
VEPNHTIHDFFGLKKLIVGKLLVVSACLDQSECVSAHSHFYCALHC